MIRIIIALLWAAVLAAFSLPAVAQNNFPTPGGSTAAGVVTMCDNGSGKFIPCATSPAIVASGTAAAINAAITKASAASGGQVFVNADTNLEAPIILQSNVSLVCANTGVVLKLNNGVNADVVVGQGAYGFFGSSSTNGISNSSIEHCTLDGNSANQVAASSTCGTADCVNGVAIYGSIITLRDVYINNVLGHGIRSQWGTTNTGTSYEWQLENVRVSTAGRHCWWNAGPSDGHVSHFIGKSCSQEADNTYDGIFMDPAGTPGGLWMEYVNIWHPGTDTKRARYSLNSIGGYCVNCELTATRSLLNMAASRTHILNGHFTGGNFINASGAGAANAGCMVNVNAGSGSIVSSDFTSTEGLAVPAAAGAGSAYYALCIGPGGNVGGNFFTSNNYNGFDTLTPFNFAHDAGNNIVTGQGATVSTTGATTFGGTPVASTILQLCYVQTGTVISTCPANNGGVICQSGPATTLPINSTETLQAHCVIPGGLSPTARVEIYANWFMTASTSAKVMNIRYATGTTGGITGGIALTVSQAAAGGANQACSLSFQNAGSVSVQKWAPGNCTTVGSQNATAINTAVPSVLSFSGTTNATDTLTLNFFSVKLIDMPFTPGVIP